MKSYSAFTDKPPPVIWGRKKWEIHILNIELSISHRLGMREALHRIQTLIPDMIEQFNHLIKNPKEEWNGSTCKFNFDIKKFPFSGKISGTFSVSESNVVIRGNGPKSLSPLKNLLENAIKTKGKELLS